MKNGNTTHTTGSQYVEIQDFKGSAGGVLKAIMPRKPPVDKIFALVLLRIVLALEGLEIRFRSLNFNDAEINALVLAGFLKVGVGSAKYNDRLLPNGKVAGSDSEVVAYGLRLQERLEGLRKNSPEARKLRSLLSLVDLANENNEEGSLKQAKLEGEDRTKPWLNDMVPWILRKAYEIWDPKQGQEHPFHPFHVIQRSMHVVETCLEANWGSERRPDADAPEELRKLFPTRLERDSEDDVRLFSLGHYAWAMWNLGYSAEEINERLAFWRTAQDEIATIYLDAKARKVEILKQEIAKGFSTETADELLAAMRTKKAAIACPVPEGEAADEDPDLGRSFFGQREDRVVLCLREPKSVVVEQMWWKEEVKGQPFEPPHVIINEQPIEDENGGASGVRFAILAKKGFDIDFSCLQEAIREEAFEQQRTLGIPEDQLVDPTFLNVRRGGKVNQLFINGSDMWDRPWQMILTMEQLKLLFYRYVGVGGEAPKAESLPMHQVTTNVLETLKSGLSAAGKTWADRLPPRPSFKKS